MANIYKSTTFELDSTNVTTVYTCPTNRTALLKSIQVSSHDGASGVDCNAYVRKSGTTDDVRIAKVEINDNPRFHNLALGCVVLESGDILKLEAESSNDLSGIISYLEIFDEKSA